MSFAFLGIDHVQLAAPAGCEQEARAFFADLLGWTELTKPVNLQKRGGVWFSCGTHQVHVGVQQDFVPAKKAHPAFHVRNLDALRSYLEQHDVRVVDDEPLEGAKRFYLFDPFGNRLEFLEWLR
jgi:catechol 2,3-dioxygenase-like lactoylglutathione lyase family enzyme